MPAIRIIYQELNLVPQLSVADNIFLGREKSCAADGWGGSTIDRWRARPRDCSTAWEQPFLRGQGRRSPNRRPAMVEIARALAFDAEIFIMDEPTSALADSEVARLFRVIADLRSAGATVLYISHKMNEIFELADRRCRAPRRPVRGHCPARRYLAGTGRSLDGWQGDCGP